jgi:hypothetical protein
VRSGEVDIGVRSNGGAGALRRVGPSDGAGSMQDSRGAFLRPVEHPGEGDADRAAVAFDDPTADQDGIHVSGGGWKDDARGYVVTPPSLNLPGVPVSVRHAEHDDLAAGIDDFCLDLAQVGCDGDDRPSSISRSPVGRSPVGRSLGVRSIVTTVPPWMTVRELMPLIPFVLRVRSVRHRGVSS